MTERIRLLIGDCRESMRTLMAESVQCCVTSPPYWGLRDYGHDGQLGLEKTPEEYVANMVEVFREVRRVLRNDGVCWLNLGDSYFGGGYSNHAINGETWKSNMNGDKRTSRQQDFKRANPNIKPKDLVGIPWRVAFALQADGWWLRQDIIWHKPNPMPESVQDRCTKAHEYIFLLTKSERYYFDALGIHEPVTGNAHSRGSGVNPKAAQNAMGSKQNASFSAAVSGLVSSRNKRSVWTVATRPYKGAHFATFPPDLIEPCILAGTSEEGACADCGAPWERIVDKTPPGRHDTEEYDKGSGKGCNKSKHAEPSKSSTIGWQPTCTCNTTEKRRCVVLDPFNGSGTTGEVARLAGCDYIGCELNEEYAKLSRKRWRQGTLV